MSYFRPLPLSNEYASTWNLEIFPQQPGDKWQKTGYLLHNGRVTMWKLSQGRKQCKLQNHMEMTFLEYQALLSPRLIEDELLQKCLHGKKQDQNRSLNGMVWLRNSKEINIGSDTFQYWCSCCC